MKILLLILFTTTLSAQIKWQGVSIGGQSVNIYKDAPTIKSISPYVISLWTWDRYSFQAQYIQPLQNNTLPVYRLAVDYMIIKRHDKREKTH